MSLAPCHSRRDFDASRGLFFCAHPKVHSKNQLVHAGICAICRHWQEPPPKTFRQIPTLVGVERKGPCLYLGDKIREEPCATCRGDIRIKVYQCNHPDHAETTIRDCTSCFDFECQLDVGSVRKWMVGVTSAPREPSTLKACVESLGNAGWSEVRLFAEPGTILPGVAADMKVTWRESTVGAWPNWYLGLAELYMREPRADAYLMVQDDAVFCHDVRKYLESVLWPDKSVGVVSVYCPSMYASAAEGFRRVAIGNGLIGALTFIFSNSSVRRMLSDMRVVAHRMSGPTAGLRYVDRIVGDWALNQQLRVYYHSPSLVSHIGESSTVWENAQIEGRREAHEFVGEEFNACTLLQS